MDELIPVTWPIREDKPRARFAAMEVDVMGPPLEEESDSKGECECAALYASGRGGPATTAPRRATSSGIAHARPPGCLGLPRLLRTEGAAETRGGGRTSRRPDRSGVRAATRKSGGSRR